MKISLAWLHELVEFDLDGAALARALTMAGLEVEGVSTFGAFSGVIGAEVRGKKPHPNAQKLTLVDVFDGTDVTQVVCGAPNVPEPGAIVLWARPGATLPSGMTLAPLGPSAERRVGRKEVRGIVSPGMLCADDELGLGDSHAGIIVLDASGGLKPGDDVAKALGLPDTILEVNVTPNRSDCLGHLGIAREVAALTGGTLKLLAPGLADGAGKPAPVRIDDVVGCPRYVAFVVDGVKVGPSPLPTRVRVTALGMRSISNVVDATNLVMFETGQPLHAFDLDTLRGGSIVVRKAKDGETLKTLDNQDRVLLPSDVLICDAERGVALGGVMGGAETEVTDKTTRVLIEAAHFDPPSVRRTAKRLGLHSEASHRFERSVDPDGAPHAARRCARLLAEMAGARAASPLHDEYPTPITPHTVSLRPARTGQVLGVSVVPHEQQRVLESIGLDVEKKGDALEVSVPPRRPDLIREIDLIEEVARLIGYDRIPSTVPLLRQVPFAPRRLDEKVRDAMAGLGFEESISYAFVPPATLGSFGFAEGDVRARPIRLKNPIREELSAMRTSLLAGLLHATQRNLARGQGELRIFEVGETFVATEGDHPVRERRHVAAVMTGHREGWLKAGERVDLFDIKGALEELLAALGFSAEFAPSAAAWLHPNLQAEVRAGDRPVGVVGELHPDLLRKLEIETRALAFEIDLDALPTPAAPHGTELPRFPSVTRDVSFFVDAGTSASQIRALMLESRDPLLVDVRVVEDFRDQGKVPAGKKGMLWSLVYRAADRTLTDAEVQAAHEGLVNRLKSRLELVLR